MKQLYTRQLNNIILYLNPSVSEEVEIDVREEDDIPSPLIELPEDYIGKILFTIYPYSKDDNPSSFYTFYIGSTYTIRIYKKISDNENFSGTENVLLKEESFLCENDYMAFQVETHAFNENDNNPLFVTIQTDGRGSSTDENLYFYASVFLTTIEDSNNRVDVGKINGEVAPTADDFAAKILENPDNLLYTNEDGAVEMSGIEDTDIVNAILSATVAVNPSIGTWTVEKILQVLAAWTAGNWRDKSGSSGTYEILDPDDGTTVILEVTAQRSTPYKQVTVRDF